MKKRVSIGSQIHELLRDSEFESALHVEEKATWESLKLVAKVFLGNRREGNYKELVESLIKAYKKHGM